MLLDLMLEVYGRESSSLSSEFRNVLAYPHLGEVSIPQSRVLSSVLLKYAAALSFSGLKGHEDYRRTNFDLLYRNIEQQRGTNQRLLEQTGRGLEQWPEMLNLAAQAGQTLLDQQQGKEENEGNNYKDELLYKVEVLLSQLRIVCHPTQRATVVDKALTKFYTTKGSVEMQRGSPHAGKYYFLRAIEFAKNTVPPHLVNYSTAGLTVMLAEAYAHMDISNKNTVMQILERALFYINSPPLTGVDMPPVEWSVSDLTPPPSNTEIKVGRDGKMIVNAAAPPATGKPGGTTFQSISYFPIGVSQDPTACPYYVRTVGKSGLIYLKIGEYSAALNHLLRALSIVTAHPEVVIVGALATAAGGTVDVALVRRMEEGLKIIEDAQHMAWWGSKNMTLPFVPLVNDLTKDGNKNGDRFGGGKKVGRSGRREQAVFIEDEGENEFYSSPPFVSL
jgi:tetratricopeptide (TPR) repeat protein